MSRSISQAESIMNRFHPVVYISFVCLSLALIVFLFYQAYDVSTTAADTNNSINTSFDKATIKKIEDLNTPNDRTHNFSLPSGRINPFVTSN